MPSQTRHGLEGQVMRKTIISVSLLFVSLICISRIDSVNADSKKLTWLPPYAYKGYEPIYYFENIIGYEAGSTARLAVIVENNAHSLMAVSSVTITFDWGENKTLDLETSPVKISLGNRYVFTISFIVPSRTIASGEIPHTYKVYIKFNANEGPIDEILSYDWNDSSPSYKFAIFSRDQVDVTNLWSRFNVYPSSPPNWMASSEAKELWYEAQSMAMNASSLHASGDFANAKTQLEAVLKRINDAFMAQIDFAFAKQEAERARTEAITITANATQLGAYGCLIGGTLIGVGVIVYGLRKPKLADTH